MLTQTFQFSTLFVLQQSKFRRVASKIKPTGGSKLKETSPNLITAVDIDECRSNADDCDQLCNNTIGSFQCGCIDGFVLSSDRRNCTG